LIAGGKGGGVWELTGVRECVCNQPVN